jgi:hypothetical protein
MYFRATSNFHLGQRVTKVSAVCCKIQSGCFAEIFAMLCPACYSEKTIKLITTRALKRAIHVECIDRIYVDGVIK